MQTIVASMEPQYLGGEVGSGGGRHYCWVGLVGGWVETRPYEIVSPPEPMGRHDLSMMMAGAKKESWAKNCEGCKMKRDDKY